MFGWLFGKATGSTVAPIAENIKDVAVSREETKQAHADAWARAKIAAAKWRPWLARAIAWSMLLYIAGTFILTWSIFVGIKNNAAWADLAYTESSLAELIELWKSLGVHIFGFAALFLTTYAGSRGLEKVSKNIGGLAGTAIGNAVERATRKRPEVVREPVEHRDTIERIPGVKAPEREVPTLTQPVDTGHMKLANTKLGKEVYAEEGEKHVIYVDTLGYMTAGIGHLLTTADPEHKLPVGTEISKQRVDEWFEADLRKCIKSAKRVVPNYGSLPREARHVFCNMAFQLGAHGLQKFEKTLQHVKARNWSGAADEMLDSLWAKQTPNRANRMAKRIRALDELHDATIATGATQ